jgi:hypothetical protein
VFISLGVDAKDLLIHFVSGCRQGPNYELHNLEQFFKSNLRLSTLYFALLLPTADIKKTPIMKLLLIRAVINDSHGCSTDV